MSSLIRFSPGATALVLDSAHSGVSYPDDPRFACDLAIMRQSEDTHVEKLYDFAPALDVAWSVALSPRAYLDANRNITEIDVSLLDAPWAEPIETDPVVGDRDGSIASKRLAKSICSHLERLGDSVAYNHPYKGVELVRRYGNPGQHRHSLQLEINRELYMDEKTPGTPCITHREFV